MAQHGFGVFCLEGQWWDDLSEKASLRGLLEMLPSWGVVDDFIHRDVGTVEEFCKFAGRWGDEYQDYQLAYFARQLEPYLAGLRCLGLLGATRRATRGPMSWSGDPPWRLLHARRTA